MRRRSGRLRASQLSLFHAAPRTPAWETLPSEVRCTVVGLLARMLRDHRARRVKVQCGKGVVHE